MTRPLIELNKVSRQYERSGRIAVGVKDVTFDVRKGEILAIVGPSGCGKTTILKIIANLIEPTSGSIRYDGKDIWHARSNGLLGYVPQSSSLLPFRTVYGNISLPLEIRGTVDPAKLERLLQLCGLDGFEEYYPVALSGGMKQKVAIARALATDPEVLLMDEPFASLDEMVKEKLNEEILRLRSVFGTTIVYVTHNIDEAAFLANRVVVLSKEPGHVIDVVHVTLPDARDSALRITEEFFRQTVSIRTSLQKT